MRILSLALLLLALGLLTGCSAVVDADQPYAAAGESVPLAAGHRVGQTFVARHAGLSGIEVWIEPTQADQGEVQLRLLDTPGSPTARAIATVPLSGTKEPGFRRFDFPIIRDSHNRSYFVSLQTTDASNGAPGVGANDLQSYLDGALYRDESPQSGQMAFRLVYAPVWILLDLAGFAVRGAWLLLLSALVYVAPGWALLALVGPRLKGLTLTHWAEQLGVSAGLSLALYPLLILWLGVLKIPAGRPAVWAVVIGAIAILIAVYRTRRPVQPLKRLQGWLAGPNLAPDLLLLLCLVLVAAGRLLTVRGLDMPLWHDSVQHTTIVQRMLESGGLFSSWEPYAPYKTLSTQFGFHALAATWAWITGADAPQAVIWSGQLLSLAAVLALYPLAYRLKGPWAGAISVAAAGLFLQFPAYYTNWGRYPQMAGQILLPVAAWCFWSVWVSERPARWLDALVGALLIAAMALTYYRMAFHFLAFVGAVVLVAPRAIFRDGLGRRVAPVAGMAAGAALLVLPWLRHLRASGDLVAAGAQPATPATLGQRMQAVSVGWQAPEAVTILVGTLAAAWGGQAAALPIVWLWLLMLLPVLAITPLPGVQIIQTFTIVTSLYIPKALIWGVAGALVLEALLVGRRRLLGGIVAGLLAVVCLWRVPALLHSVDRGFDLSTRPDMRAAEWIKASVPEEAFFLINGLVYTDGVSAVGGDAGWWIPVLTGRGAVIPPQYALLAEDPIQPGYGEAVNTLVRSLNTIDAASEEGHRIICSFPTPITHAYIGQRQGMVVKALPARPEKPMLSAEALAGDPAFQLIYASDGVSIFAFDRSVCS